MLQYDFDASAAYWVAATCIATFYLARRRISSAFPLPPGPKKLPLIGNLFDIPTAQQWDVYSAWCKRYDSDIIHLNALGNDLIVLGSAKAARDLLEGRSSLYSSRPRMPMVVELMGWHFDWAFMPYGDLWRAHRRVSNQSFNENASKKFRPLQLQVTRAFLHDLLTNPDAFRAHIRLLTGRTIMSVMYGIDVHDKEDPYLVNAETALTSLFEAAIPGRFLVDAFPWLKYVPSWFPGAQFQRDAKVWREEARKMLDLPFEDTKARIAAGTAKASFVSEHLASMPTSSTEAALHEKVVMNVAGTAYAAAIDTTAAMLATFFLTMVDHPEIQAKAQAELDRVLGRGVLPTFEDEKMLPYINAIIKELARWRPVVPLGVVHVLDVDDIYNGYRLPKGSLCIPNIWSMLHDEVYGPDADSFNPERFLQPNSVPDPLTVFGFGRRICPGRHLAHSTVFITITSVLSTFVIGKAIDDEGMEINPSGEFNNGLAITPDAFKCTIKPRSKDAVDLISTFVDAA